MESKILFDNLDKIHTTELGIARIQRNLKMESTDVVSFCKEQIQKKDCKIYRQGKNWYCETGNIKITINAYTYTIITAHII